MQITKGQARRFLIRYHGLDEVCSLSGEAGILAYMKRAGCIQYDPLDVVGRNVDLVLQARISDYSKAMLEKLLYADRVLIDGWDKMASVYPVDDWPFFSRLRKRRGEEMEHILERRDSSEALGILDEIRFGLQSRGPLRAMQMKMGEAGKGSWGHRNLSGAAMDYLFNIGEIGIRGKKSTQRVYDLIGNLLPDILLQSPDPFPDDRSFVNWYVERRVGSVGLLWARNGGGWLGHYLSDKALRTSVLEGLVVEGRLKTISVEGITEPFYVRSLDAGLLSDILEMPTDQDIRERNPLSPAKDPCCGKSLNYGKIGVRVLAPLDNLLWDRDMIARLFDFHYAWEVYAPAEKRKYGYYVLPVLYGDRFVARFEPEPQRGNAPLAIKNWWWEKGFSVHDQAKSEILGGLEKFAGYLGTTLNMEKPFW